uniref:UBN2 domain-containing protein n=1 Tax=Nicotiana tabacum TaxID=4097 RepID=A0A1S3YKV2_TOBAC|nr:PREDICTED: uncharacterized protein LOC107777372 [Nicotiana tabacum]
MRKAWKQVRSKSDEVIKRLRRPRATGAKSEMDGIFESMKLIYIYPCFAVFTFFPTAIFNENARIPMLSDENYTEWKEKVLLILGCSDLDLALRVDEPPIPTKSSTPAAKANYERWERSNRLSLILIKAHISQSIRGSIPNSDKVKTYMKAIDEQFVSSDKALASTLMKRLSNMTFDRSRIVHEHIMEMRDIAAKLKSLEVDMSEPFLVHFILNSLLAEYGPFKISYNTHKDKWSIRLIW